MSNIAINPNAYKSTRLDQMLQARAAAANLLDEIRGLVRDLDDARLDGLSTSEVKAELIQLRRALLDIADEV